MAFNGSLEKFWMFTPGLYRTIVISILIYKVSVIAVKCENMCIIRTCVTFLDPKCKKREYVSLIISDS